MPFASKTFSIKEIFSPSLLLVLTMKFLHTSDWHLGRTLYGKRRLEDFTAFLDWLKNCINEEDIDLLLIAGDIFDTTTPSNSAQKLYYQFLCDVAQSSCEHIVIIGGNHDSPSFLNAPQQLLSAINVHVVGSASENVDDEIVVATKDGIPQALICAVPYLRDKDVRKMEAGESAETKQKNLVAGIENHYQEVRTRALEKRDTLQAPLPIIGMGHLFTTGGKVQEDDGVRDLYVGNLATIHASKIAESFDYLALGHLHIPQRVDGNETIRYCGSPIPMGFGEAKQTKKIIIGEFNKSGELTLTDKDIPSFQKLAQVSGNLEEILAALHEYAQLETSLWLEVRYTGKTAIHDLRAKIEEACAGTQIDVLRIQNTFVRHHVLQRLESEEKLDDLSPKEVFSRCLLSHEKDDAEELLHNFSEILTSVLEKDHE